jgi:hypothetical protein
VTLLQITTSGGETPNRIIEFVLLHGDRLDAWA